MTVQIAADADVASDVTLGDGTVVWSLAQVRAGARLGQQVTIGRGAYVGAGVEIGDRVKIQNYALVYEPAHVERWAFVGPAAVLTNDRHPRATNPDGTRKWVGDWDPVGVTVCEGASIGARAVCVAPLVVGPWAFVAAGSVVTRDVPAYALVAGSPARWLGWVGRSGERLRPEDDRIWRCPRTGARYLEVDRVLAPLDEPCDSHG